MVLLTMTPAAVRAMADLGEAANDALAQLLASGEPSLREPVAGKPISHAQYIALSNLLKEHASGLNPDQPIDFHAAYSLDTLLKGARVFIPPPRPRSEPTSEYKALMARLRTQEEARAYQRMLSPPSAAEISAQRFPVTPQAHFDTNLATFEDDDVSYEEVHRQIVLIINVLVSIIGSAVFIWMAAWHWTAPTRLGLSMGGSALIAVAEVVIYNGYLRRVKAAKSKEKKKPEIKEIVQSWIIDSASEQTTAASATASSQGEYVRYRKGKHR